MTLPSGLSPMLATAGPLPPEDGRWAYEVKWDGYRALVAVDGDRVGLRSRTGKDTTGTFPGLPQVSSPLPVLLDAEVVAFDEQGRPSFELLQTRGSHSAPMALVVFDLLHAGDESLLALTYDERRAALEALGLEGAQVPPAFTEGGAALLASTREQGLEGVLAKRRDSTYDPGRRSDHWVKVKNVRRQSAVVIGWKPGDGGRSGSVASLLLAVNERDALVFAGHVGTGFTQAELRRLGGVLSRVAADDPACEVPREHARVARWVRPELVAEVEFTAWTREGRLRHPSYKGLREDVEPEQVVRE